MSLQFFYIRVFSLLLLAAVGLVVWFPVIPLSAREDGYLTVKFLDVGQGDAIQVTTPDGYELLVDGGPGSAVLRQLSESRSFFDKKIDVVVATHPDTDHVGGLVGVLERYQVDWLFETGVVSDTPAAFAYREAADFEEARKVVAQAGQTIQLGASTTIKILSPHGDVTNWQTNNASIVLQIVYGDVEFMLTGDAPSTIEEYLVREYGDALESEVLKLGHHGSDTSSSADFLEAVGPQYGVVSAGRNNRYGHPREEVLMRAGFAGAQVVSTVEEGTIVFKSDGKRVWLSN